MVFGSGGPWCSSTTCLFYDKLTVLILLLFFFASLLSLQSVPTSKKILVSGYCPHSYKIHFKPFVRPFLNLFSGVSVLMPEFGLEHETEMGFELESQSEN